MSRPDDATPAASCGAVADLDTFDSLRVEVRRLGDRLALRDLVASYMSSLDAMSFDDVWARSLFTDDVRISFPVGDHAGIAHLAEFTTGFMSRWATTHHHATDCLADVVGDRAAVRWSLLAAHVHHSPGTGDRLAHQEPFRLGGYFDAKAVRTGAGWRFNRLGLRVLWATGRPPSAASSPGQ